MATPPVPTTDAGPPATPPPRQRVSFATWMANLHIQWVTWARGELVGTDRFGNRYFRGRKRSGRERRWVLYNGEPEASKVPPEWHLWLHHTTKEPLPEAGPDRKPWQKDHLPNPTGTVQAYRPPGHVLQGGHRARATGDYEPWTPQ